MTPHRSKRWTAACAALLVAALLAVTSGCGSDSAGASSSKSDTLTWGWTMPTTWDSAVAIGYDVHVLSLVYSGLTKLSPTGEAQPDLAESWKYDDAGDAVTFQLRPGQTFSDGTPLNAAAVKKSIERGRDLKGSTAAQSLAVIEEVTADSDTAVTLHLSRVDYQVPLLLAGLIGHILSPKQIDSGENIALHPVGSGPFVLQDYVPDSHADLARNPTYWNAAEIKIPKLVVVPKPDASVAVAGVESGQYTIAHIPESQIDAAKKAGLRVDVNQIYNVYHLAVNTRMEPFTNPLVAQALSHAIDRQALIDGVLFGYGTADWQSWNKQSVAYNKELDNLYPFDVAKAKELLAEAGHPDGVDITLYTYADPTVQKLAEVVQAQVAASGFRLKLEVLPPGGGVLQAHQFALSFSSFSGRESPVQGLEVLYSSGGWMNVSEQQAPDLQAALDAARRVPLDDPTYPSVIQAATKVAVTENAPSIYLVNWVRAYAISPKVKGFDPYLHTQRFEGVELTDESS